MHLRALFSQFLTFSFSVRWFGLSSTIVSWLGCRVEQLFCGSQIGYLLYGYNQAVQL
jgi:phosphotransferase system  glucose/maltose/N-acetylglucosamine-specific IIC component